MYEANEIQSDMYKIAYSVEPKIILKKKMKKEHDLS